MLAKRRKIPESDVNVDESLHSPDQFSTISENLHSSDREKQMIGLNTLKQYQTTASLNSAMVDKIEDDDMVRVIELLGHPEETNIVRTAVWTLINQTFVEGKPGEVCMRCGLPEKLKPIEEYQTAKKDVNMLQDVQWLTSNIAAENQEWADEFVRCGVLERSWSLAAAIESQDLLSQILTLQQNMFRQKATMTAEQVQSLVSLAMQLLHKLESDGELWVNALWLLAQSMEADNHHPLMSDQEQLLNLLFGVQQKVYFKNDQMSMKSTNAFLRLIGNLISDQDDSWSEYLRTKFKVANHILCVTRNAKHMVIEKEVIWLVSNMCCSSNEMVNEVFSSGLLAECFTLMRKTKNDKAKAEMSYIIQNLLDRGEVDTNRKLEEFECVDIIATELNAQARHPRSTLVMWLKTLRLLFDTFVKFNDRSIITAFEEMGGLDSLEKMQEHADRAVQDLAVEILTQQVGVNEDEEEENTEGVTPSNNGFNF